MNWPLLGTSFVLARHDQPEDQDQNTETMAWSMYLSNHGDARE